MWDANYVIAGAVAVTFVVTWTLGRFIERVREPLGIVNGLVTRVCLGLVLALVAAQAAVHGGYWWIIVPFLGLLALWNFTLSAGMVWVWGRGDLEERD